MGSVLPQQKTQQPTMGLEDLIPDDAGGSSGGRPKSRKIGETIEPAGEPFLPDKDSEDWWLDRIDDVEERNPILKKNSLSELQFSHQAEVIGSISDLVSLHPVEVRKKLDEHGILETDWEEYIDFYPESVLDDRVPGYDKRGYTPQVEEDPWDGGESTTSFGDDEETSGLMSLVEDAKE